MRGWMLAAMMGAVMAVHAQNTMRGPLRRAVDSAQVAVADTAHTVGADTLAIGRYDKPLRSRHETFAVENRLDSGRLLSLTLDIVYRDMQGAMLHARRLTLPCDIPPGQTRQLRTTAWDTQERYYHQLTRAAVKSERAIPFDVELLPRAVRVAAE